MAQVGNGCRYRSHLLMLAFHCPARHQRLVGLQRIPVVEELMDSFSLCFEKKQPNGLKARVAYLDIVAAKLLNFDRKLIKTMCSPPPYMAT